MEVKCNVCGTMNDTRNKFCKGCFIPLHKTVGEWNRDLENKVNKALADKITDETTLLDKVDINIWDNIPHENDDVNKVTPDIESSLDDTKTTDKEESLDNTADVLNINPVEIETSHNDDLLDNDIVHINTPISTKEVDDIKNDLDNLSIINNKEVNMNEKSAFALSFKFNLILIVLTGLFTYFYGIKIDTNQDIVYSALATFLISGLATILTFKNHYPSNKDVVQTLMLIYITFILFECALRSILLYNAGINYLYYYIFVYVIYILIAIVTINAINRFIRTNNSNYNNNFISKLNSFSLIVTLLLIIFGGVAKNKNYTVIEKSLIDNNTSVEYELPSELLDYITSINNKIIENTNNDANYKAPELITDKNFVETNLEIEDVSLAIDDYGTVSSGEIKYNGKVYKYKY